MGTLRDLGSFRDPSGHVYRVEDKVYRTMSPAAAAAYEDVKKTGFLDRITDDGLFVGAREVDPRVLGDERPVARYLVEHPCVPFISYPYEWSFPMLKVAAVFHLDLHLQALEFGVTLSDASAYNVQFLGPRPVFIDLLSFRPYVEGEFWTGHAQFCEQFLNPLLLRALFGVPHNAWYRGNLEGIPTTDLARLMPFQRKLSWRVAAHVLMQQRMQSSARTKSSDDLKNLTRRKLPLSALQKILRGLRDWVVSLTPKLGQATQWADYEATNTYGLVEGQAKKDFVSSFAEKAKPRLILDLGCNAGAYSEAALRAGARYGVGFDLDQGALEAAFARATAKDLQLLPLFLDATNPSPDQGWQQRERRGLEARADADALIALAFVHHLAISRNVPLDQVVTWLTGLASQGVIEFVPKADPTIQTMLALRKDIFSDYCEEAFENCLSQRAKIIRAETVSSQGRRLYWYARA